MIIRILCISLITSTFAVVWQHIELYLLSMHVCGLGGHFDCPLMFAGSGLKAGPVALNAARPGLKCGPAAHTILRNRNAPSHATSKRRPPPGLVYCEVKLTTVGMPT